MKRFNLHPQIPAIGSMIALGLSATACSQTAADLAWQASSDAIGPISATTEFSIEALSATTDDLLFSPATRSAEGMSYDVIVGTHVLQDGTLVFIEDDMSGSIGGADITLAGVVANGLADIGAHFAETGLTPENCFPGMEERSGQFVCFSPEQAYLNYWFYPEGYRGPDGELPPAEVMADALLFEIRWTPGF